MKIFIALTKRTHIRQRDASDCGPACLCSIAAYHGRYVSVSAARQYAGTGTAGTTVLGLLGAAKMIGYEAKAVRGTVRNLPEVPLPLIAHLRNAGGEEHFVVLYAVGRNQLRVMDPADGAMHRISIQRFTGIWSGVMVLLVPAAVGTQQNPVTTSRRLWRLARQYRSKVLTAFGAALVYAALGLVMSVYLQTIADRVLPQRNTSLLAFLSWVVVAATLVQLLAGVVKSRLSLHIARGLDESLIMGYYRHVLHLPKRFFDTMQAGEIISRINDAIRIREFISETVPGLLLQVIVVCLSMSLMLWYYWKLALIAIGIVPVYAGLYFAGKRVHRKWQQRLMEKQAAAESQLVETLSSAVTLKHLGAERYAIGKTHKVFQALLDDGVAIGRKTVYLATASELASRLFTVGIVWSGSWFVIHEEMSAGEMLSFFALSAYFTNAVVTLTGASRPMQEMLLAAGRLFEITDLEAEIPGSADCAPGVLRGDIVFHDIHFGYPGSRPLFTGLDITIRHASLTAVVGESGSGKSTLAALLQRLYIPGKGNIRIGGTDTGEYSVKQLRKCIAIVPQTVDLFSDTIAGNIAIGEAEPDMIRIVSICELLGIHPFIEALPHAYQTAIGGRSTGLSGGQAQRIAIARALYACPEILVLDEATSALDAIAEQFVLNALQWFVASGKTAIVIAHRLTITQRCDTILVLRSGVVCEQGTHQELIEANGYYDSLWKQYQPVPGQ